MITYDYLAGFFDGEGSIGMYRNQGSLDLRYKRGRKSASWIRSVSVVNTYRPILETFKSYFGGVISPMKLPNSRKPCYQWQLHSKYDIRRCLDSLLPYLIEKQQQAKLMLDECEGGMDSFAIAKNLKELKHAPSLIS